MRLIDRWTEFRLRHNEAYDEQLCFMFVGNAYIAFILHDDDWPVDNPTGETTQYKGRTYDLISEHVFDDPSLNAAIRRPTRRAAVLLGRRVAKARAEAKQRSALALT